MMNHKNPNKENTSPNTTMHMPTNLSFIFAMVFGTHQQQGKLVMERR
jgi:hypothetical protein